MPTSMQQVDTHFIHECPHSSEFIVMYKGKQHVGLFPGLSLQAFVICCMKSGKNAWMGFSLDVCHVYVSRLCAW